MLMDAEIDGVSEIEDGDGVTILARFFLPEILQNPQQIQHPTHNAAQLLQ